ncbi:uncharacterized protein C8Q71DRAFT_853795 [Rhodofomes roseus]|uniref:Uncharacterized protein n=1 Tax=Rhodofomes roseus TaxID=34475 RepID=A0ABQ8KSG5_9APHY|nr:uncharacterized protein C8Q71DRAFT_853795 [Rhodofomes roseus]KAH9841396.1 hypothetical protein C8Q71DRAFT_853795 [Rhodofomes roseus]
MSPNGLRVTSLAHGAHAVGAGGYWSLYDWNPSWEDDAAFKLGSDAIKNKVRAPLDRQNHPSQFVVAQPQLPSELRVFGPLGEQLRAAHKAHVPKAEGGKAKKVAKRLAACTNIRSLIASVAPMDAVSLEDHGACDACSW